MQAIVYTQYGSPEVLQLVNIPIPDPKDDQVLVKVHAASVNALDYRRFEKLSTISRLMEERFIKSVGKALGADISGTVEAVGASVKQFQPGDEVFGVSAGSVGGFAEYACAADHQLALKPANLSFEAAAAAPVAAITALLALRDKGRVQPGHKALINGASGGVGSFAVQIAKAIGTDVTAVCSTRNLDVAHAIGADHVVDYTKEDFTKNGLRFNLILAVSGDHSIFDYWRALSPAGIYVAIGGSMTQIIQGMLLGPVLSRIGSKQMGFMGIAKPNQQDLIYIGELLEAGQVVPVIDRCYPLSEIPEAIRYLVKEHAKGKIVITMGYHPS